MENSTSLQIAKSSRKKVIRFLIVLGIIAGLLIISVGGAYAWYISHNPCEIKDVEAASEFMVAQLNRFDDVAQVAGTAYRAELVRPLYEMQQTYMDTQQVDVPACLGTAKTELLDYMGAIIAGFDAYSASEADSTVMNLFNQSDKHYENFRSKLKVIKECAPYCLPWE